MFETVSTVFSLLKDIPVSLWKAVERPLAKAVVAVRLRRANKKLPSKQELYRLAFSALGGQIDEVIGFRDIPTKRLRIACLWRESVRSYNCHLVIIEAFGEGIRTLWQSQQDVYLTANARIEVADISCDGKHEIYFVSSSFGTGGGSTQLYCLTPETNGVSYEASYVSWQHEWTTWKSRPMPTLVSGPNVSAATLALLEKMAEQLKLNPKAVLNPESAEAAVFRWHRDNADLVFGQVIIHWYNGLPVCRSTILAQLQTELSEFTAHFKGPVFCFDKILLRHCVIWAPGWIYHWPMALEFQGDHLYIGTRGSGLLRFNMNNHLIYQLREYGGQSFEEVESIAFIDALNGGHGLRNQRIVVNGSIEIPFIVFDELEARAVSLANVNRAYVRK